MLTALHKRNGAMLWLGQLVSLCGDALLIIAVPSLVYQRTGSVLQTGIALVAQALPAVLLSSFASVFVDRWHRRVTMLTAELLRAAVLLLMGLAPSAELLWVLSVARTAQSMITQFFTPASMALIPLLVEKVPLMSANSLSSLSHSVLRLIGPVLGGILFLALGLTGSVSPQLPLVLILTGLLGMFTVGLVGTWDTLLQSATESRSLGRVFGTRPTVTSLAMLISMTLSGGPGDRLGVVPWMTISGMLLLLSGFIALLTLRQTRFPPMDKQATEERRALSLGTAKSAR